MKLKHQVRVDSRSILAMLGLALGLQLMLGATAWAGAKEDEALGLANNFFRDGKYFRSARYAFDALSGSEVQRSEAYYQVTRSLMKAGLYHSASYFFIRTLQSGDQQAIKNVLQYAEPLIMTVGLDILRDYFIRHTRLDQYGAKSMAAYLYASGKKNLLSKHEQEAIKEFSQIPRNSQLRPFALQLRGTAYAILGQDRQALNDFRECVSQASRIVNRLTADQEVSPLWAKLQLQQVDDLQNRCQAGIARTYYQMKDFRAADFEYDLIPKASFVWTDILFEQAWNAYSKQEYNRTLGKLVSYKSPALSFVHNSEIPVLRSLSYLALCLYDDASLEVQRSLPEMEEVGVLARRFLQKHENRLIPFYDIGKKALRDKLHTRDSFHRLLNRFVRSPYFTQFVQSEKTIQQERAAIAQFVDIQRDASQSLTRGFPGFLNMVLEWRLYSLSQTGGAFIRNSVLDYYQTLVKDAENLNFIKIEMLSRAKDKLRYGLNADRSRGHIVPSRRGDQYYWSFNGEFWNDEIGDYVFALNSECQK